MLGKKTRPVIMKLPDPLTCGDRTGSPDMIMSPKSPLEFRIRSPRAIKNCELSGVGLGIIAALEKSGGARSRIAVQFVVGNLNVNRSGPIAIGSAKTSAKCRGGDHVEKSEMGCRESYSCVISNKSFRKVNFDGDEALRTFPPSDFLSSCYLCRKELHGKDIYMYRGEKAFCSTECRCRQIVIDECKEKCGSVASRSSNISGSPYSGGHLFSTGIIAA